MDKKNMQNILDEIVATKESFSSNMHGIAQDAHPLPPQYDIPSGYESDRIVLMPVNLSTYHIYWELSENFLHKNHIQKDTKLSFRILDENHTIIEEFFSQEKKGKRYINKVIDDHFLQVQCGYYLGNRYISLLYSNKIKSFNSKIKLPQANDEIWLTKYKGYSEVIRASLQHFTLGISSASYVKQIEKLTEYSKSKSYSSGALAKKGGDNE